MTRRIRDGQTEALAAEVASPAGETRDDRLLVFMEREIWSHVPPEQRGRLITKREREAILGYGESTAPSHRTRPEPGEYP